MRSECIGGRTARSKSMQLNYQRRMGRGFSRTKSVRLHVDALAGYPICVTCRDLFGCQLTLGRPRTESEVACYVRHRTDSRLRCRHDVSLFAAEKHVSRINLKQWVGGLKNAVGRRPVRVAPHVTDPERATRSKAVDSAAMPCDASVEGEQAAYPRPRNRRAERIRSWRRRALLRKGARLHSAMKANSETGSLAMLDDGGIVVSWYERAEGGAADDRVVDNHMSQFYVAEDLALGLPVRDLCSAAIHGHSTQTGWRRFPEGATCWATTVIEPIMLRDGRLQGFSHVTRRSSDAHSNVRAVQDRATPRRWKGNAQGLGLPGATLVALMLMVVGSAVHVASAAESSIPQHTRKSSYGGGWECLSGYSRSGDGCAPVVVPANAYLDASGSSWACKRGYRNIDNACAPVKVPRNAYLEGSYGPGWECARGYREAQGACVAVVIPANAYAVDSAHGLGWECNRGFKLASGACVGVAVPVNGYLTRQGDDWKCDRGFKQVSDACTAIQLPANAYLDRRGNDWICERGFRKGDTQCEAVQLPASSHLTYSGDDWRCDTGFRRQGTVCTAE